MAKQQVAQKYILKIHTDRLKKAKWKLSLTLDEARQNDEVISIGDSQMLRWIDELNGFDDPSAEITAMRKEIRRLKAGPGSVHDRRRVKCLYEKIDKLQFKPDYVHLVVDRNKDFLRACKGFTINDTRYVRLVGTSGGVKMSTVVFVNAELATELRKRIDNGRNTEVQFVPAKLEAYRALTCSGSIPVSMPRGIAVVPDCVTRFKEDVLYLTDENDGEPELRLWKDFDVELTESDGYGLMLPSLAERWSEELKLGYTMSAANTRWSFEKGCVFSFDFLEFADKVAGTRIIKDVWGHEIDISNVELILTESMLKLWGSYDSIEHYMRCCEENHYTIGIAKTAPKELEDRRTLNYQFIQSYDLTDDQINELIMLTMDEIREIINGDYRKALLFMAGNKIDELSILNQPDYIKAMMANPEMFNDPFIKRKLKNALSKRIDDAKIGVLSVHGNYSILCGDPYALCQSIFGLDVTGLLKAGEIYNRYWVDSGAEQVAVFRAPMSTKENRLKRKVARSEEIYHWYQYITTCTLFNAWDDGCAALNGADKDGDIVFITDNNVLVDNLEPTLTLVCAQKSAQKKIVTEDDLILSNIAGFGNEVGAVTNRVTSMYEVQAQFEPGSAEYETLAYRIQSGQMAQQNSIDKTKGIVCKPMPRYWYDYHAIQRPETDDPVELERYELNKRIVADKKPYFMRYVYPQLNKEYKEYIKAANASAVMEFGLTATELTEKEESELTQRQREFLEYYKRFIPVGMHDCTMNRLCRRVEQLASGILSEMREAKFDHRILITGTSYKPYQYYELRNLFKEYSKKTREIGAQIATRHNSKITMTDYYTSVATYFRRHAFEICLNQWQLTDILIDLCYTKEKNKQFVWDTVGGPIVEKMLKANGGYFYFPIMDPDGDFEYMGERYSMMKVEASAVYGSGFERI